MSTFEERFWARVKKGGPDTCWVWQGKSKTRGYGVLFIGSRANRKSLYAHRTAYTLINGPIPASTQVNHSCHNRLCANPNHLHLGNSKSNMQEMLAAGGCGDSRNKLSESQKDELVAYLEAGISGYEVARRFGVSRTAVRKYAQKLERLEAITDDSDPISIRMTVVA